MKGDIYYSPVLERIVIISPHDWKNHNWMYVQYENASYLESIKNLIKIMVNGKYVKIGSL
jgi:hypothetical protein